MASRYFFTYTDYQGQTMQGQISSPFYTGQPTEIQGYALESLDASGNPFQAIQAKRAALFLEASIEEDLSDIYNEDDRYWLFQLSQNNQIIFQGYLSTEGIEEPYNADRWVLTLNAIDHLSYLGNYGYYDADGQPFTGRATVFQILQNCINKTFATSSQRLAYNLAHAFTYEGQTIFQSAYIDQAQFYNDEGEGENCKKVLEDVLKSIGCYILQHNQQWHVVYLGLWVSYLTRPITFLRYNGEGLSQGVQTLTNTPDQQFIGDQFRGAATHHINQPTYTTNSFYKNVRLRHEFDYADQILANGEMVASGGSMPNWVLSAGVAVVGNTVEVDGVQTVSQPTIQLTSTAVALMQGDELELQINVTYVDNPTEAWYQLLLTNTSSGAEYSYAVLQRVEDGDEFSGGEWLALPVGSLVNDKIEFTTGAGEYEHNIQLPQLPEDGDVLFRVYNPVYGAAFNSGQSKSIVSSVVLKAFEYPVEALEYTVERTDKSTGKIPDVVNVRFNTSAQNILKNIFLDGEGVAIEAFDDGGQPVKMMQALAVMHLTFFSNNYKIWSGEVYNNHPFSTKNIDFVGGPFLVTTEEKDFKTGFSRLQMIEVSDSVPPFVGIEKRVYRKEIKATINS